jgi:hypothetical protein
VIFGALGDIHGDFDSARRIVRQHPEVPFWLCVGDVADGAGRYEPLGAPVYWIKGNNENFDLIASGGFPDGLHHIPNGTLQTISGLRVAGLGGTYAPTMFELPAAELPYPGMRANENRSACGPSEAPEGSRPEAGRRASARGGGAPRAVKDDRRRHFVRQEVDACTVMTDVDILLSHEAPRPYVVGRGNDAGKTPINDVLAAMKPRLHLFGHHHRFTEAERQGVRSVGLDLVSKSYLLIDSGTLEYHRRL